ncbi:MAG: 4-hydroxy-3-methylbut-2-enyl diphosphate reductase [Bacteroidetes bacterium]|nr:4-hydroxy-3-methylbut-2-enyl diphosphate reductase [Bacteroidota bacterium]
MKTFNVPQFYRSPIISKVKEFRKLNDPRKKDISPSVLKFDKVTYYIARHFGFCYGVENAIEIAFKAVEENKGKNIYLLSQMIHNPKVNADLLSYGLKFLNDTEGNELIPINQLQSNDVVIIPAFGAPLSIIKQLEEKGIKTEAYNTTCPFVERVWKKSEQIGKTNHTIIIHGKYTHEETRSTFSRSKEHSEAVIVIKNMQEAELLASYITKNKSQNSFEEDFKDKFSKNFDIHLHLNKIGVINQTTMLASETAEIANFFKQIMIKKYGINSIKNHFADTNDTLCYATNENQDATAGLLQTDADIAIVVGGYNSSNTMHIVELCENKFKTFFISGPSEINKNTIHHFNWKTKEKIITENFLPSNLPAKIIITSGASCPDSVLDAVIQTINNTLNDASNLNDVITNLSIYKHAN